MHPDQEHAATGPPTGLQSERRVSVKEAAAILHTTVEGVRARTKRGTLRKEKAADGTVYIILDAKQASPDADQTDPASNQTSPDEHPDRNRTPEDSPAVEVLRAQIEMLQAEVKDWKRVVDTRDRELEARTEELRRKDHIMAALTERIPAIEPPSEPSEAPETASDNSNRVETPEKEDRASWWRRLFS